MARRTVVANQKGGVGKTTTAMNLAACLAMAGRRTLLVDFDPQGNATTGLGMAKDPAKGTFALLDGRSAEIVSPTRVPGLDMLTSSPGVQEFEGGLAGEARRQEVTRALEAQGTAYDEVVVDCPPALGGVTRTCLPWATCILVPIQCEFFAMEGLAQILAVLAQVEGEREEAGVARVLLTMFDPDLPFHREVVENLKAHLGSKLYRTVIVRDVALAEAASHGVPVVEYDPLSRGAFAYIELGKEILGHGGEKAG